MPILIELALMQVSHELNGTCYNAFWVHASIDQLAMSWTLPYVLVSTQTHMLHTHARAHTNALTHTHKRLDT